MTDVGLNPREYLAPPTDAFWKWGENAEAVVWRSSGETIAFRLELEHLLRTLVQHECQLPSLSLVLLVLAACRDSWGTVLEEGGFTAVLPVVRLHRNNWDRLYSGLFKIWRLEPRLRYSIEAKGHIVQFIFAACESRWSGKGALRVCDKLLHRSTFLNRFPLRSDVSRQDTLEGLAALLDGLDRLNEEALQLRITTGLDELMRQAEFKVDDWTQVRALVSSLVDDQEHGGLARLARALMAVVHLPRPLHESEELPLGGFSDIENRGSLDRLLVSELAHDDLTLAVRVALNEALYLRRETPPKTPALARSILIDVGIRMWGVPRVFATSVALALMATADHHAGASVYRAKGMQIEKADLTTRDGLVEHLSVLEPDVHPGRSLARFRAESQREDTRSDCVIVTIAESVDDRQFQQYLARQVDGRVYLATVTRSGAFQLLHQGAHGRKVICEAQLSLDDLLQGGHQTRPPLIDASEDQDLPDMFYAAPFPLLLPGFRFNIGQSWVVPRCGVFEIAPDQRLLFWTSPIYGPQLIVDRVPIKRLVLWSDLEIRDHKTSAVFGIAPDELQLLTVDVVTHDVTLEHLEIANPPEMPCQYVFCAKAGMLLAITDDEVAAFSRTGSQMVKRFTLKLESENGELRHCRSRFFRAEMRDVWYAICFDEREAHFEIVVDASTAREYSVIDMFDWIGHEGPVGITNQAELYFPEERRVRQLRDEIKVGAAVRGISPCGEWVHVERSSPSAWNQHCVVSLSSGHVFDAQSTSGSQQLGHQEWVGTSCGDLHRKFTGVAAGKDDVALTLVSTKEMAWAIKLQDGKLQLQPNVTRAKDLNAEIKKFVQNIPVANATYRLLVAAWQDGSQAIIDSRGLLHLRSSDDRIPAATLVLVDGEMAGWCADGRTWGNSYFTGGSGTADPRDIFDEVILPFVEQLT